MTPWRGRGVQQSPPMARTLMASIGRPSFFTAASLKSAAATRFKQSCFDISCSRLDGQVIIKLKPLRIHILTIALAVLVAFGISTTAATSGNSESWPSTLTDRSVAASSLHDMDCGGPDNICQTDNDHQSHVSGCCGFMPQGPVRVLAASPDNSARGATNVPATNSFGPPSRPPRISA